MSRERFAVFFFFTGYSVKIRHRFFGILFRRMKFTMANGQISVLTNFGLAFGARAVQKIKTIIWPL
jgi:hypothetical protein